MTDHGVELNEFMHWSTKVCSSCVNCEHILFVIINYFILSLLILGAKGGRLQVKARKGHIKMMVENCHSMMLMMSY